MNVEKAIIEQPTRGGIVAAIGPELGQLLVVGLWASTFIVTKAAFAEVSPLAFAFVRFGDGERGICQGRPVQCRDGWQYDGSLSQFSADLNASLKFSDPDYYFGRYALGPLPSLDATARFVASNPGGLTENFAREHSTNDPLKYNASEKVYAGYAMDTTQFGMSTVSLIFRSPATLHRA